jgi:hypothetical protein
VFVTGLAAELMAQPGQRPSDRDVEAIFESVYQDRDRFEDQLDGNLKRATLRGPSGEAKVEQYLEDFQRNVETMRDRFDKDYAASTEVRTVLRQASEIHRFMKGQPADLKGGSEWERLVVNLNRLAEAYGTTFPVTEESPVRRINDAETSKAAEAVASQADRLKSEIGRDKSMAKAEQDVLKRDLDTLKAQANVLKSRASDGKPASAETRQLSESIGRVTTALGTRTLSPVAGTAWGTMQKNLDTLAQAYGMPALRAVR